MSNNTTEGEIFILAVPDDRAGEIELNEDYNLYVYPSLLQDNLYRVQCVGQPRIVHRSEGFRRGFGRSLSFQTVHLSVQEYNQLLLYINNRRMAIFVPDEQGHIQMIYNPRRRTKINVVGKDEVNHEICAESDSDYPYHTPITLLTRMDGSPLTVQEFETMVNK